MRVSCGWCSWARREQSNEQSKKYRADDERREKIRDVNPASRGSDAGILVSQKKKETKKKKKKRKKGGEIRKRFRRSTAITGNCGGRSLTCDFLFLLRNARIALKGLRSMEFDGLTFDLSSTPYSVHLFDDDVADHF